MPKALRLYGFVSSDFSAKVIDVLADNGVKIILLRCAVLIMLTLKS